MKRLNPNDLPAALHTAKVLANVAAHLRRVGLPSRDADAAHVLMQAAGILGYELTLAGIRSGTDPTVARALELTRKAMGVQS